MPEKKVTKKVNDLEEVVVDNSQEVKITETNYSNVAFWVLAITTFLIPIAFLPLSVLGQVQTKLSILIVGTIIALILSIVQIIKDGRIFLNWGSRYVLIGLVGVSVFISSILGINTTRSLIGSANELDTFSTTLAGFVFVLLTSYLSNSQKRVSTLLRVFLGSIVVTMLVQILRLALGETLSLGILSSPVNTLVGSWSDIALLSLLLLGSLVVVLESVRLKKWLYIIMSVFTLVPFLFIALSGLSFDFYFFSVSLLFVISILSVLIFTYTYSLHKTKSSSLVTSGEDGPKKSKLSISFVVLVFAIVFLIFGSQISGFLSDKTGVKYVEGRPNWQATYLVAEKVIDQKPFFGSGPNTFDIEWSLFKTPDVNNHPFWNNEFSFGVGVIPTTLVTTGIVGLILFVLFYVYVVAMAFRSLFNANQVVGNVSRIIISYGVLLTTFVMVFYAGGIVILFAHLLFIGLLFAINPELKRTKEIVFDKSQWVNFITTLLFIVTIIASVYWLYVISIKFVANNYYRRAVIQKDTSEAIAMVKKSLLFDPLEPVYYQTLGELYAAKVQQMMSLSEAQIVERKVELNENIKNSINYLVVGENLDRNDFKLKLNTGKVLEFFGSIGLPDAYKGAIDKYMAASLNSPANPLPFLFASNIALIEGDSASASSYLQKAIYLKSDYTDVPGLGNEIKQLINKLDKVTEPAPVKPATTTDTKAKAK
jgi:hypothetical protein